MYALLLRGSLKLFKEHTSETFAEFVTNLECFGLGFVLPFTHKTRIRNQNVLVSS